jgi:hypothetical protein
VDGLAQLSNGRSAAKFVREPINFADSLASRPLPTSTLANASDG